MSWKAQVIGSDGNPVTFSISEIVAELTSGEGATWTISPTTGSGTEITGTVKADAYSEGTLKATYDVAGNSGTSSSETLTFIQVDYVSLEVTQHEDFSLWQMDDGDLRMGGATKHKGEVKVTPAAMRDKVDIRLDQYLNSITVVAGTPSGGKNGHDTAYSSYAQNITDKGTDSLNVESGECPGVKMTKGQWLNLANETVKDATFDAKFHLYLQAKTTDATEWKTFGQYIWGVNGGLNWNVNKQPQAGFEVKPGSKTNIKSAAESQPGTPQAPSSPNW